MDCVWPLFKRNCFSQTESVKSHLIALIKNFKATIVFNKDEKLSEKSAKKPWCSVAVQRKLCVFKKIDSFLVNPGWFLNQIRIFLERS